MAIVNYDPPRDPFIKILYRDEDVVVLDKPSGLLTVPGKAPEHKDSLELRVKSVLPEARIVHRLDMATSGILVMALNKESHKQLSIQFQNRQTSKTYYAKVLGVPSANRGTIELPLICDWPNRPKQMVDFLRGKPSTTHWQLLASDGESSMIELTPITGRSHQLRVHMLSLGHPILGDRLYACPKALEMSPRLLLHAASLTFAHPQSNKTLDFSSSCPFSIYG